MTFLGSLLREGTQMGSGYIQGKQQKQADQADMQRQMVEAALERQYKEAQINQMNANTQRMSAPAKPAAPPNLTQFDIEGMLREQMKPGMEDQQIFDNVLNNNLDLTGPQAQSGLARIRAQEATATRAEGTTKRAEEAAARAAAKAVETEDGGDPVFERQQVNNILSQIQQIQTVRTKDPADKELQAFAGRQIKNLLDLGGYADITELQQHRDRLMSGQDQVAPPGALRSGNNLQQELLAGQQQQAPDPRIGAALQRINALPDGPEKAALLQRVQALSGGM